MTRYLRVTRRWLLKDWPRSIRVLPRVITRNLVGSFRDSSCLHVLSLSLSLSFSRLVFPSFAVSQPPFSTSSSPPYPSPLSLSLSLSLPFHRYSLLFFFRQRGGKHAFGGNVDGTTPTFPHSREIVRMRRVSRVVVGAMKILQENFIARTSLAISPISIFDRASYRGYRFFCAPDRNDAS